MASRLLRSGSIFGKGLAKNFAAKRFYAKDGPKSKGVVVGVYEKEDDGGCAKLTSSGQKVDDRTSGKLSEILSEVNLSGKVGYGKIFNNLDSDFRTIALIGLGKEGIGFNEAEELDEGMENARIAAGVGARALQYQGVEEVHVESFEYPEQAAEGAALAIWRYQDHKRKKHRTQIPKLELFDSPDVDAWTRGLFKAEAQNLARRLSDSPANQMTPTAFAQAAVDALCPCGVTVEIRTMEWIEQQQLNSFLMIAKGSCEPPIFLEISYCGTSPGDSPILLVGKGITFNSGGICIRRGKGMDEYRASMAGAACVVGAIRAAAALSLPVNVTGVIPLCENMPSGMAVKPGDVVRLMNGKTLAVQDTSRAGVVMLADPLIYSQNTFKPRLVVDVATLDKGVVSGLAGACSALFTNSTFVWKQFQKAGTLTGDRMWRMPLWRYYKKLVTEFPSFDISNTGKGPATSCLAAAILHECVPCVDWAHIDIRGVGMLTRVNPQPYLLKGRMSGRPTRTLIQFLFQMACPDTQKK